MKLQTIRLQNFQSFGNTPTEIHLEDVTYLIGPNGSGKTAALISLCRVFSVDPALRRVQPSDFHISPAGEPVGERRLWIEFDFVFPELLEDGSGATVAPHFGHMRLDAADGIPRVRFRLNASMGIDGEIEESLVYVLDVDDDGQPLNTAVVPRAERNYIHVHYLPARRDPADHITYGANALLGRLLRAVNWDGERAKIKGFTDEISQSLAANVSINSFSQSLHGVWGGLHKGSFFSDPKITFVASDIEALLRHLSISFSPGHDGQLVDFSRLSDGQKSMLYLSLVLSSQSIGRAVLSGEETSFDPVKLRPPVFTIVGAEEPENSLSAHYLGRIVSELTKMASKSDAQALIATHAPSMLRRVEPENIRYLRLSTERVSKVTRIQMPAKADEAHKFVREAVQAFPEIYFSRLVVLGEGDSEEVVLPRVLRAKGAAVDESAVTIAPLGGRHVNHFWRLLSALEIPHITLLDLDVARHGGGWGRIKYVNDQLGTFALAKKLPEEYGIPVWNDANELVRDYSNYNDLLESRDVFFSTPMDLDFAMLEAYPVQYGFSGALPPPSAAMRSAVLGPSHHNADQYSTDELELFGPYHQRFKLSSKPAAHINALAQLSDEQLLAALPDYLGRLADAVIAKLAELPE